MTSLFYLVAEAKDRCLRSDLAESFSMDIQFDRYRMTFALQAAELVADEVVRLAWQGDYPLARRLARVFEDHAELADEPPDDEPLDYEGCPDLFARLHLATRVPRDLFELAYSHGWASFAWVCELADRIDSLLAALERPGPAAAQARGCREDLAGLSILADWCEEAGLVHAAAEARHLNGLARREIR